MKTFSIFSGSRYLLQTSRLVGIDQDIKLMVFVRVNREPSTSKS